MIDATSIDRAREVVSSTPLVPSALSAPEREVRLKLENLQPTGAFKVRGAANRLRDLTPNARGVVTVSTGNHGRAVAHVARELGVRAVVCISRRVPANKVAALEATGAEVHVVGDSQDEAEVFARRIAAEERLELIHPFDDPSVIAGQGTIGLELLERWPAVDTIVVPLSGGGLLGGIALAVKSARPEVRVVGVSAAQTPVMLDSLAAGHPIERAEQPTVADSLLGGVGLANRYTFALVRDLVDEHVVVGEAEIERAMAWAYLEEGQTLEGAGAATLAAAMRYPLGRHVALVASGGNVDPDLLAGIVARYRTSQVTA
ncbi:MAG: pyridoxal-phosphate dependent enzyme [Deltaproteobacteria bacterium]